MIKAKEAKELFRKEFGHEGEKVVFSHGRLEIIGNHTDHNKGVAIVGGVDIGITADIAKTNDGIISIASEGFQSFKVDINESLEAKPEEKNTSAAFVRGCVHGLKRLGYKVGGFKAACSSDIPSGSGVSSSACYCALLCGIINILYNDGKITNDDMILCSQYAEVIHYGKPCGMLDQTGCIYGGMDYVDFLRNGAITPMHFNANLKEVLIISRQNHEGGGDYGSIPADMRSVASNIFGKEVLGLVSEAEFRKRITQPCAGVSELAKLRAIHFFDENKRVEMAKTAIETNDVATFLRMINESGQSSTNFLQNAMVPGHYENSPRQIVDTIQPWIGKGAARMMGGGYGGSVLCFIFPTDYDAFLNNARATFGAENVFPIKILEGGVSIVE